MEGPSAAAGPELTPVPGFSPRDMVPLVHSRALSAGLPVCNTHCGPRPSRAAGQHGPAVRGFSPLIRRRTVKRPTSGIYLNEASQPHLSAHVHLGFATLRPVMSTERRATLTSGASGWGYRISRRNGQYPNGLASAEDSRRRSITVPALPRGPAHRATFLLPVCRIRRLHRLRIEPVDWLPPGLRKYPAYGYRHARDPLRASVFHASVANQPANACFRAGGTRTGSTGPPRSSDAGWEAPVPAITFFEFTLAPGWQLDDDRWARVAGSLILARDGASADIKPGSRPATTP